MCRQWGQLLDIGGTLKLSKTDTTTHRFFGMVKQNRAVAKVGNEYREKNSVGQMVVGSTVL